MPLPYFTRQGSALLDTTAISSSSWQSLPEPQRWPTKWPTELSWDCFLLRQLKTSRLAVDITPCSGRPERFTAKMISRYVARPSHFSGTGRVERRLWRTLGETGRASSLTVSHDAAAFFVEKFASECTWSIPVWSTAEVSWNLITFMQCYQK